MATLFVEGFSHYGGGTAGVANMLNGVWAQVDTFSTLDTPSWAAQNEGLWFHASTGDQTPTRVALPVAGPGPFFIALSYGVSALPTVNNTNRIISLRDSGNLEMARLTCESTGTLALYNGDGLLLLVTASPAITAKTRFFLEMSYTQSGAFVLKVNDVQVLSAAGLAVGKTIISTLTSNAIAQLAIAYNSVGGSGFNDQFVKDLVVRDSTGTRNNNFGGDSRVATLLPNASTSIDGWTPRPRKKIGTGILDTTAINASIREGTTTATDLGSGDFTLEQFIRFTSLPTGSNKSQIIGKWDETNNRRSYQLYLGGPSLEGGNLVFRITTGGTAATVNELISWPWVPQLNRWYHVAVVRATSEVLLFIDGVQQGLQVADANVYFAGTAPLGLAAQIEGTNTVISNTGFTGYMDEVRMTVGFARYTVNFTPTTAAFPRNVASDPQFANVQVLAGFDAGIADESSYARALTANNGAVMNTPVDGSFSYQTISKSAPSDDTFIEAPLIAATGILTQTALPAATKTITVGTHSSPPVAAVYTWVSALSAAYQVLIGATMTASLSNLIAAINAGAGAGTVYGTGTLVNNDVSAEALLTQQMIVTATVPGTGGNAIASTTTDPNGSWDGATLSGGINIPGPSQFTFQRPPQSVTVIKSVTMVTRQQKSDAGTSTTQTGFVGPLANISQGASRPISTAMSYYEDTFETDPDTAGNLTVSTIIGGRLQINRTG